MAFLVWMNVVYFYGLPGKICHLALYLKFTQDLVGSLSKSLVVSKNTHLHATLVHGYLFSLTVFIYVLQIWVFHIFFFLQCLFEIDLKFLR